MASLTGVPYLPPSVNLPTFNVEAFPSAVSFADVSVLKGIYQDTVTNQVLVNSNQVKASSLAKLYSYPVDITTGLTLLTTYTVGTIPANIIPNGIQALVYVSINVSAQGATRLTTMTIGLSGFFTQLYAQNVTYTGSNNIQKYMSQQVMFPITGTGNAINVTLEVGGTNGTLYDLNVGTSYTDYNFYDIQVVLL